MGEENSEEICIIKQKKFSLILDKNIEYKTNIFISNNYLFCINILSINNYPNKKYSLSLTSNDLNKNRFFKIFVNIDEIYRELEKKIEKSSIIEDTNAIYLNIPIGLIVIKDIILQFKETDKSKDEYINELIEELNIKENKISELENKMKENENKFKFI